MTLTREDAELLEPIWWQIHINAAEIEARQAVRLGYPSVSAMLQRLNPQAVSLNCPRWEREKRFDDLQ